MSERQTAAEAVAAENDARRLAVQYAVAARDAEWRAAVEGMKRDVPYLHLSSLTFKLGYEAALDSLLRAMEAPDA